MIITFYNCRFTNRFTLKYTNLKLKFRTRKNFVRRVSLSGALSLLSCLNHLSSSSSTAFRPGFQNRFMLQLFRSNALIILVLFLQIIWTVEFTRTNFRHGSFLFSVACPVTNFYSTLKTFLSFVTVATLSRYQSPANCKERRGQFYAPASVDGLPLQG
jgi:hypothetical protein